jgi:hypothetical protein
LITKPWTPLEAERDFETIRPTFPDLTWRVFSVNRNSKLSGIIWMRTLMHGYRYRLLFVIKDRRLDGRDGESDAEMEGEGDNAGGESDDDDDDAGGDETDN